MITETAAGGSLDEGQVAVPLMDDMAVQEFAAQFETEAMTTRLQEAVAQTDVPDDMVAVRRGRGDRVRLAAPTCT